MRGDPNDVRSPTGGIEARATIGFVIHEDRRRAGSFGEDAEQYNRARPDYPAQLIDDLLGPDIRRVLDVGCGTGIAARQFRTRGCAVLGVEPDARMASIAQRDGIDVAVVGFEAWEPPSEPFDLLISAQAWHWVDPTIGVSKAGSVLRPGGRFAAFWNSYAHAPDVQAAFAEVYERHAPELLAGSLTLGISSGSIDDASALRASDLFEAVEQRRYPWMRVYQRDEWLDQLPTHSDHRTMAPETLAALLGELRDAIDMLGGRITVAHNARLVTARRVG